MEIEYNSSNPYNFTFALNRKNEKYGYEVLKRQYDPYKPFVYILFGLLFRSLKNVRFQFVKKKEIVQRLSLVTNINKIDEGDQYDLAFEATSYGGLPSSVWVLVGFSLLVVSGLATYFSLETEKKDRRKRPLNSWMNNVGIYAADIVNNCVVGVIRSGPGRHLRSWWLLGVVFLMQFWAAGMKIDILIDKSTFIDSIEDLMSRPELILFISKNYEYDNIFGDSESDPRFKDYKKKNIRFVDSIFDKKWVTLLINGSGVTLGQEIIARSYNDFRVKKLKEANRKRYNGKKCYRERYSRMIFNKQLPRAIKEDIDYVISRLFETGQTEPKLRRSKFRAREFIFDSTDKSASTMSWFAQNVAFLSPVFRLWLIGMSLAIFAFCVEFYQIRRRTVKVSPRHSMGFRIRA